MALDGTYAEFRFPEGTDLGKIKQLVEAYNKRATGYGGFALWSFDEATRTLQGRVEEKSNSGFWGGMKATYQFGELEADFKKICKEAEKIANDRIVNKLPGN